MSHAMSPEVSILADSGYGSGSEKASASANTSMEVDVSPTLKRKASLDNAQTSSKEVKKPASKKAKADAPAENVVELKAGKLVYKQKTLALDMLTSTLSEQVAFRDYAEKQEEPLEEIPTEHWPLFSKLVHESERTLNELAKEIKKKVDPENEDSQGGTGNKVSIDVIKACINQVADRRNYGLTMADSPDRDANPPPSLCIYRWEARDLAHFPEDLMAKIQERFDQRQDVQSDARTIVSGLSDEDLNELFSKGGKKISGPAKAKKADVVDLDGDDGMQVEDKPAKKASKPKKEKVVAEPATPKEETPEEREKREAEEAEKAEKEAKKEIKKAEKEAKQQKEAAKQKATKASAGLFSSWLGKPAKAPAPAASKPASSSASPEQTRIVKVAVPEVSDESDFDKTFLPFQLKKGFTMAPINRFAEGRDEPGKVQINTHDDLTLSSVLSEFMANVPTSRIPKGATRPRPAVNVAELMQAITEGELSGNGGRKYYNQLRDRSKLPVKTLKFHSDHRPGYRGTWSKFSKVIRPRAPLERDDDMLRYDYDSGEDWEEEPEGEDVEMEEEEEEMSEEESDGEGWLAGDDDAIEYEEGFDPDADPDQPNDRDDASTAQAKRVVAKRSQAIANKKRKITGPLQPVCKGPFFENAEGEVEWDILRSFRIGFLNEARPGLDPLIYEAATPADFITKNGQTSLKGFYTTAAPASTSTKAVKPSSASAASNKKAGPGKSTFPSSDISAFIDFVQKTDITGKAKLREALQARFPTATKISVEDLFKANVSQIGKAKNNSLKWVISQELLSQAQPATTPEATSDA